MNKNLLSITLLTTALLASPVYAATNQVKKPTLNNVKQKVEGTSSTKKAEIKNKVETISIIDPEKQYKNTIKAANDTYQNSIKEAQQKLLIAKKQAKSKNALKNVQKEFTIDTENATKRLKTSLELARDQFKATKNKK